MMELSASRLVCRSRAFPCRVSAIAMLLVLSSVASAQEITTVTADLPRDLSPWGMFQSADWVVKSVMIGLLFASVVTWTVWLAKSLELLAAKRNARRALDVLASARSL